MNNLYQKKSVWIFNISRYFEIWFVYDQVTNYLENESSALHSGEKSVKLPARRCQVEQSCSRSLLVHWAVVDQETKFCWTLWVRMIKLQERDMCAKWNKSTPLLVHMSNVDNSLSATVRYIFTSKTGLFHAPSTLMTILTKNMYNFDSYFTIFYIVEFCFTIFDQDSNRDNPRDIWFDLTWQLRVTLDCICNSHDVFYMRSSPFKQFWQYPCLVHGISPLFWREHLDPWWARSKLGGGKFLPNVAPSRQNIFAQQRSSPNWNPSFASLCAVGAQKSWQAYKLQTALRALGWVASSCCGTGHTSLQWIGCISMCTLHVALVCCLSRIVPE